jgi:hypothetical protein
MSRTVTSTRPARLVFVGDGPLRGQQFMLRPGVQSIGRSAEAAITLALPELSSEHALLFFDGAGVAVADAGSRNGTSVNGEPVHERRALKPGDVLDLGGARLRFEFDDAPEDATRELFASVGRDNYGQIMQAGRDVVIDQRTVQDDGWEELFQGSGFGRFLLAVGGLIALAGFAGWGYLIISGFSLTDPSGPTPFDTQWFGVPAFGVAGAMFLGGIILSGIGSGMSKAKRARAARR